MICYRFVRHAMTVRKYLGEEHANVYFNIVMLFVESVLPCTVTGIAFVISFGLGSRAEVVLSRAWTLMMVSYWCPHLQSSMLTAFSV